MLNSFPITVIVASLLGFLAGLGVGGGSVLILWLTLVLAMPHETAKGINLLFFLPAAIISCIFRWKQGSLSFKKVLPAMIAGIISALIFTNLAHILPPKILRPAFGILLLFTGAKEMFYRPRKAR